MPDRPQHFDLLDTLRTLPDSAQRPDAIDVESETVNLPAVPTSRNLLPAVRATPGELADPDADARLSDQIAGLADAAWARPWPGWWWAQRLADAIRTGDAATFRHLVESGLAHGFDGQVVTAGEFYLALLEVDAQLAGAVV